ncbi:MAG: DUF58 domain-containing protein, partial [Bdellovibrionales bacterium]|nr:DUF58 domain-containing protein [Bdellovibrionales bacterium]
GQGMTFSEFREYVPGDDIRAISWPLTARTGKTFIKKYDEEREMTLILAVDVSGSEDFGSQNYFKGEVIAHLAALLGFSASKNNDPVGLLLFSDQVEHYVPPKKGHGQIHRILRDLYYFRPKSRKTNISVALEFLQGVLKKRSNVFIFSDFFDEGYDKPLRMMGQKHDTVSVIVNDPLELELPDLGLVDLQDAETGEIVTIDTSSKLFRQYYRETLLKSQEERDRNLKRTQIDKIEVNTDNDFTAPLIAFFKKRNRSR